MADVLKRSEYEQLFVTVDAVLRAYKAHDGALSPLDQEVFIELRSLRMWLSSLLRARAHHEPSEDETVSSAAGIHAGPASRRVQG